MSVASLARPTLGRWVTAALLVLALFTSFAALLGAHTAARADDAVQALAARIAALAADRSIARLRADQVVARLQPIVALKAGTPSEAEWSFSGQAPDAGIVWTRADFQAGSKRGSWQFQQLQIGLSSGNSSVVAAASNAAGAPPEPLGPAVARELTRRLGKPKTPPSGKAEQVRIWQLGAGRVVSLREGSFVNPIDERRHTVLLVEVVIEQGEPG